MKLFQSIRTGLPSQTTTPFNRLIGLSLGIIHLPSALAGLFFTILALAALPILPFVLPMSIGGLYLYVNYWRIFNNDLSFNKARRIWSWSRNANLLLAGAVFGFLASKGFDAESLFLLIPCGFMLFTSFLSHVAGRDLVKNQAQSSQ